MSLEASREKQENTKPDQEKHRALKRNYPLQELPHDP